MQRLFLIFITTIFCLRIAAQEFNYVHYDTKDGLAGSTVYDMCQDKEGFIWFATENGLSRYDGSRVRNFTVKDGLPDNEVLKIFADSKGRVWVGTFTKEICYYFKGQIYNKRNSAFVRKIILQGAAIAICEDERGNLIIGDLKTLVEITNTDDVNEVGASQEFKIHKFEKPYPATDYKNGGFFLYGKDSVFKYSGNGLTFFKLGRSLASDREFSIRLFESNNAWIEVPDTRINQTYYKNTVIFVSAVNGVWSVDTIKNRLHTHFLPGKRVSHTIRDTEGDLWFSTMGEGVYKLPSAETRTISLPKRVPLIIRKYSR